MIHNRNCFRIQSSSYLDEYKVGFGIVEKIKIDNGVVPYCNTSIDGSKSVAFVKAYSEFLERTRVGFNTFQNKKKLVYDYANNKCEEVDSTYVGYGYNEKYGVLDTTGTASGLDSHSNMVKSLLELIEKNELMLLWYKKMGSKVVVTEEVKKMLIDIGFDSKEIYIYISKNISNAYSATVVILDNHKIISSGVSADLNINASVKNALLEAKMFEKLYRENKQSPYAKYSYEEHNTICRYIYQLNNSIEYISVEDPSITCQEEIIPASWIDDICYAVLNTEKCQKFLTVRCLSSKLACCLPTKKNICRMPNKEIIKKYDVLKSLEMVPDCCIL